MTSYIKRITGLVCIIAITQTTVCDFSWGADKKPTETAVTEDSRLNSILSWRPWKTKTNVIDSNLAQGKPFLLGKYAGKTDEEILRDLQNKPSRTYEEMIDIGTLSLVQGEYLRASDSYEVAAQLARNEKELSGALFNKAGAQAYCSLADARYTIDIAARLQPRNYEIVKLRYALNELSGNPLGTIVAQDQLLRLDPSMAGHEVEFAILGYVAITAILAITIHDVAVYALTPPKDRPEVAKSMLSDYYKVIGTITVPSSRVTPALADYMLKKA